MAECKCPEVKVGGKPTGSYNWNPDCPVHPWDENLQAQSDRAVEWQRRAAEARKNQSIRTEIDHDGPVYEKRVYRNPDLDETETRREKVTGESEKDLNDGPTTHVRTPRRLSAPPGME